MKMERWDKGKSHRDIIRPLSIEKLLDTILFYAIARNAQGCAMSVSGTNRERGSQSSRSIVVEFDIKKYIYCTLFLSLNSVKFHSNTIRESIILSCMDFFHAPSYGA